MAPGCSGPVRKLPPRLPFHVALLPAKILDDAMGDSTTGLQVAFEPEWMNATLAEELRRTTFVKVTTIAIPAELGADSAQRDRYAIEQSSAADLIVQPIIRYDSRITAGSNERFLDSLHLFFTGPFLSWGLEDWDYSFGGRPVEMTARTYFSDTAEAPLRFASRLDQKVLEDDPQVEADDPALTFVERTGDNWEQYAVALLVPSGLLAGDEKTAAEGIRAEVVKSLAENLAIKLSREPRLFANPHKANIRLTRKAPLTTLTAAGARMVSIGVAVCDPTRPGLESYSSDRGKRITIPKQSSQSYVITTIVPADQATLKLSIFDAQDSMRSFTFDLLTEENDLDE